MKQYIETKVISAEPAFIMGGKVRTGPIPTGIAHESGYRVIYPDGYEEFIHENAFEKACLPISSNESLTGGAPGISQTMVEDFIAETNVMTLGEKTTVVRAVLRNGFEIVEASACVSKENYSEDMGRDICMKKIKDKVWMLLGFLLQTAVNGIR